MPQPKTREQIELEKLWRFEGRDSDFWKELLLVYARQTDAASGGIMIRSSAEEESNTWTFLAIWPDSEETKQRFSSQHAVLSKLSEQQIAEEFDRFQSIEVIENLRAGALRLNLETTGIHCVAVFLRYGIEDFFHPSARIVKLMADTPLIYGADPESQLAEEQKSVQRHHSPRLENPLSPVVSLGLVMNQEKRFLASAMLLCNELTARFQSDQVSLGWRKGNYIKILATNHSGKVEGKMETTRLLAAAMEECVDQDDEIVFPGEDTARAIYRDHETYAKKEGLKHIVSIPIRSGGEPIAAITLERIAPFEEAELDVLRLSADLVSHRLVDLKSRDRWFGARCTSSLYRGLKKSVWHGTHPS